MDQPSRRRAPAWALAATVSSCYGLLALTGLAASLGLNLAVDDAWWRAGIVGFGAVTVATLFGGWRRHGSPWPLLAALAGLALLAHALHVDPSWLREALAFGQLFVAVWADRRRCRARARPVPPCNGRSGSRRRS